MITLDITPEEQQILVEVLNSTVSDLSTEIAHTDEREYRETLKKRKQAISRILGTLH